MEDGGWRCPLNPPTRLGEGAKPKPEGGL